MAEVKKSVANKLGINYEIVKIPHYCDCGGKFNLSYSGGSDQTGMLVCDKCCVIFCQPIQRKK